MAGNRSLLYFFFKYPCSEKLLTVIFSGICGKWDYIGLCVFGEFHFLQSYTMCMFSSKPVFYFTTIKTMMLYPFCKNNRAKQGLSSLLQWSVTMSLSEGKNLCGFQNTSFPVICTGNCTLGSVCLLHKTQGSGVQIVHLPHTGWVT